VIVLIDLVDRDEVVVGDRGRRPRFAAKPLPRHLVVGQLRIDHLDRDVAGQAGIVRVQHHPHSAAADDADDPERAECPEPIGLVGGLEKIEVGAVLGHRFFRGAVEE
jgi:hypothetical protein